MLKRSLKDFWGFEGDVMHYKKFVVGILSSSIFVIMGWFFFTYLIDPIGIWGAPVIQGFNHYKATQTRYEDVFKVYEIMRVKPNVVYIGSSEVDLGFDVSAFNTTDARTYNMGIGSGRLWDIREYLRFIYKIYPPEKIFLGLNLYILSTVGYWDEQRLLRNRPNFSVSRLQNLSGNLFDYSYQIIKDTIGVHKNISTIMDSKNHIADMQMFRMGWNSIGSNTSEINKRGFYTTMGHIIKAREKIEYSPEALKVLSDIVYEAKKNGVVLYVFFTPTTVDRYSVYNDLTGNHQSIQQIKKMVSQITPVYDFYLANELSVNYANFYDSGHFRPVVGEIIKHCIENEDPSPYGALLTPETVDVAFAVEDEAWKKWRAENAEYVQVLTECIESGREPQVGDFEKYIGF